jgi:hypothetical protein
MSVLKRSLIVGAGSAAAVALLPVLSGGMWFVGSFATTGSGGLGAVSAGVSDAIIEAVPIGLVATVLSWVLFRRHRPA